MSEVRTIRAAEWATVADDVAAVWQSLSMWQRTIMQDIGDGIRVWRPAIPSYVSHLAELRLVDLKYGTDGTIDVTLTGLGKRVLAAGAPTVTPLPGAAGDKYDGVNVRRYDHYTYDDLLARVIDQDRIIHELYTGKHGVTPHPSEVYQAGLWEIYKPDEHQGHAERVGDVGELKRLRGELAAAGLRESGLAELISDVYAVANAAEKDRLHLTINEIMRRCMKVAIINGI